MFGKPNGDTPDFFSLINISFLKFMLNIRIYTIIVQYMHTYRSMCAFELFECLLIEIYAGAFIDLFISLRNCRNVVLKPLKLRTF